MEDAFGRFVEVLAGCLDEPEVAGDELAARLHLSRAQFDRVVSAAAGEAPDRLRRRVLLERAAFRLRTTEAGVLDVAVEAGYSSHEAFTRAFRRAFGTAPAVWRGSAAGFLLAAPNDVHFYPPGGLRLPARRQVRSMNFVPGLIEHHAAVVGRLLDAAGALPSELKPQLDKPIELSVMSIDVDPTPRSVLARLVGQLEMWTCAMANEPYDVTQERERTLGELREQLDRVGPAFVATVRRIDAEDRFDETFVDVTGGEPYIFTAAGMIAHILTYAAYRRTLVVGALAALGADVEDDPLAWFTAST
ncbi:helix-turn-helix domain-containing protein [Kribbella qitaiheensis]|uniref:helix-turn-helix domain-containing protein n=1 Tax=Kribbella qitaiheensis TaxID=1544730 RepID=UPI0036203C5D